MVKTVEIEQSVKTVGIEQSDGIAAAAAAVVGQSIKMAEAITRLICLASRLIRVESWPS